MRIAIVGAGRMGKWFASYFRKHVVKLYDKGDSLNELPSFDAIILAVSLNQMRKIVLKIRKIVKPSQLVWDIASVKSFFIKEFRKLNCRKASVHPMFGPSAHSMKDQNVVLISDVGSKRNQKEVAKLFRGARITRLTARKHDEVMAFVLCLPYLINFAFNDLTRNKFNSFAGPTFGNQKQLAEKIL